MVSYISFTHSPFFCASDCGGSAPFFGCILQLVLLGFILVALAFFSAVRFGSQAIRQKKGRKMTEKEIEAAIKAKGWDYNLCSRFLVVTGVTPARLASIAGVQRSVVSRWVKGEVVLPAFVNWAFLAFCKLKMHGVNVMDYF